MPHRSELVHTIPFIQVTSQQSAQHQESDVNISFWNSKAFLVVHQSDLQHHIHGISSLKVPCQIFKRHKNSKLLHQSSNFLSQMHQTLCHHLLLKSWIRDRQQKNQTKNFFKCHCVLLCDFIIVKWLYIINGIEIENWI